MRALFLIFLSVTLLRAETYQVNSPDGSLDIEVQIGEKVSFSVSKGKQKLILPSIIDLSIHRVGFMGERAQVANTQKKEIRQTLISVVPVKSKYICDQFNELAINFKNGAGLQFRVYNEGLAYRWSTNFNRTIQVDSEVVQFKFGGDFLTYFPEEESFFSHHERLYKTYRLSEIKGRKFCSLPMLIVKPNSTTKILITESDLFHYPGMFLKGSDRQKNGLIGIFPHYPLETKMKRDRDVPVTKYAPYLAKCNGKRTFPWRVLIVTDKDEQLLENQMVFKLARPTKITDSSWIKPGKVAWDWWNALNLYGVDFRAGVNTQTYKYYVDFAAKYGIEYILLDEGWYELGNLLKVVPAVNIQEIVRYAHSKNVGVILWVVWKTLNDQLEEAFHQFDKWGIDGIKVDFMQRDDQWMVEYYEKIAREAAQHHLLVDFHGSYKPAGLRRAYPNVLTREGVPGLEHNKWSNNTATPEMACTLPFIRMVAGPMDYTPGAMINATKDQFHPVWDRPMSQGTRCQQLALYVLFESPLQMLADSPSNYLREKDAMEFLSTVPTTWDTTIALQAKIADYLAMARKKGDDWFVAAITDWTARDLKIKLDFLELSQYQADIFQDGLNADRNAIDYKRIKLNVKPGQQLSIHLAPGGGWVAHIKPLK